MRHIRMWVGLTCALPARSQDRKTQVSMILSARESRNLAWGYLPARMKLAKSICPDVASTVCKAAFEEIRAELPDLADYLLRTLEFAKDPAARALGKSLEH